MLTAPWTGRGVACFSSTATFSREDLAHFIRPTSPLQEVQSGVSLARWTHSTRPGPVPRSVIVFFAASGGAADGITALQAATGAGQEEESCLYAHFPQPARGLGLGWRLFSGTDLTACSTPCPHN